MPAAHLGAEGHGRGRGALSSLVGALLTTLQRVCHGRCWGPEDCHHRADNTTGHRLNPELGQVPTTASGRNLVSEPAEVPCELGW